MIGNLDLSDSVGSFGAGLETFVVFGSGGRSKAGCLKAVDCSGDDCRSDLESVDCSLYIGFGIAQSGLVD